MGGGRRLGILFLIAGVPLISGALLRVIRKHTPPSAPEVRARTDAATAKPARDPARDQRGRCDEGPPSAEARAEWRRSSPKRPLDALPMAALGKRKDRELVSELYARLLDELYTATGFGGMTRVEQNTYLALAMHAEVMNGGFHQFFANSTGNCAARTAEALAEIGEGAPGALYRLALAKFPQSAPPEDRATRVAQMEALTDERATWEAIDRQYYEVRLPDRVLARYARAHADAFTLPVGADAPSLDARAPDAAPPGR